MTAPLELLRRAWRANGPERRLRRLRETCDPRALAESRVRHPSSTRDDDPNRELASSRRDSEKPPRPDIQLRRVYNEIDEADAGHRALVDRLWPRGISKADVALDEWLKDVAPSTELRRWYGHDVRRFDEFERRYRAELRRPPASSALDRLVALSRTQKITLLTATSPA